MLRSESFRTACKLYLSSNVASCANYDSHLKEPVTQHYRLLSLLSGGFEIRRVFLRVFNVESMPLRVLCRPLHIAARNGLATVVQALLNRGATVLAVDEEGTPSSGYTPGHLFLGLKRTGALFAGRLSFCKLPCE